MSLDSFRPRYGAFAAPCNRLPQRTVVRPIACSMEPFLKVWRHDFPLDRAFSSVVFSVITMTTNGTVPAHHRGTMNGLSMLGGSLAKSCGPIFGGLLFSNSVSRITPPFGSVFVYCVISALGICLGILTLFLKEYDQHHKNEEISKAKKDHDKELGEKPLTF